MYEELDKSVKALSGEEMAKRILEALPTTFDEQVQKNISLKIESLIDKQTSDIKIARANLKAEIDSRIQALASSTKDLEKVPVVGTLGLFIRGMQRPIWTLSLLYVDLKVLSNSWTITAGSQVESVFWLLNLLILGFLFGERAVKNVMPVINQRLGK